MCILKCKNQISSDVGILLHQYIHLLWLYLFIIFMKLYHSRWYNFHASFNVYAHTYCLRVEHKKGCFLKRLIHCHTRSLLLQILLSFVFFLSAVSMFLWKSEQSPIQLETLPLANTKNSMSYFVTLNFVFRAELLKTSHFCFCPDVPKIPILITAVTYEWQSVRLMITCCLYANITCCLVKYRLPLKVPFFQ